MIVFNKNQLFQLAILMVFSVVVTACDDEDMDMDSGYDPNAVYMQEDQMARPAINTVFNSTDMQKNDFNTTTPVEQSSAFSASFVSRLKALNPGYTTNALGLDAETFGGLLATDVLNVATQGKTTFFDGTNVLTGRALPDDVIDVELLLLFGGPDGTQNAGLTSDHVDANDKAFSQSFPYLASPH